MAGLIETMALAGGMVGVWVWAAVAVMLPALATRRPALVRGAASARLWLYAPLWVPALMLGAALLPGIVGSVTGHGDHCLEHVTHHHLCLIHPPHVAHTWSLWGLALLPWLGASVMVGRHLGALKGALASTRTLVGVSRALGDDSKVRVVETGEAVAFSVGLLRPVVVVSRGLVEALSEAELRVVLAHERAHCARRDTLWALADQCVAWLLPARARQVLLDAIELGREQACDARAANEEGRVQVAATLLKVARLKLATPAVGLSLGASSLELRVERLLAQNEPARQTHPVGVWLAVLVIMGLGAGPFHGLMERVIALALH
ncbi:M48 family metalloprotease [Lujinxingia vulgaris]|uniref:M48 family metalloprotease n=1 Tax=Lujinxingia vulgaris TaxID=2600176 RepID=A0A5C6XGV0_9DELT|nr:M56 family metallopeptidase [Lujinxingia vulgaris]TXD39094.1 M48 family metalloprotease [Lujinxingia vulgaris]